jgi:putative ABC transport system permease protein
MKYVPLVWAGLWRKPARTVLTTLSIAVAFLLTGLLQGVNAGFAETIAKAHRDLLTTDPRVRGSPPMPIAMIDEIRKVPGVITVAPRSYFIADYRPPNTVAAVATEPRAYFAARPMFHAEPAALAAMERVRPGLLVTPALLQVSGWKVGDLLTLRSHELKLDGTGDWQFEIVGTFNVANPRSPASFGIMNYSYLDEARVANRGTVERFFVRIADPDRSVATAAAIDKLFANSSHETRTRSDQERAQANAQQMGDIGFFTNAILAAVSFMVLFLTANTLRQSVEERIPEYGVLKAMGFSDAKCSALTLVEAATIFVAGALLGLILASLVAPLARDIAPAISVSRSVIARGIGLAMLLASASVALPCWKLYRLSVVSAVSGRHA